MNYRYMRLIVLFDVPMETSSDIKSYTKFLKELKKLGFYMFQKSVYMKLAIDQQSANSTEREIRKILPKNGIVSLLTITEKQFGDLKMLMGEIDTDVINSDERIIEL